MWEKIKHFVTGHPWMTGLIVFGVGVVIVLLLRSGSAGATTSDDSSDQSASVSAQAAAVQAGTALQAEQIQGQAAIGVAQSDNATQTAMYNALQTLGLAQYASQDQQAAIQGQTTVDVANIQANQGIQENAQNTQAAVDITNSNNSAADYQSGLTYNLGVTQANLLAQTTQNANNLVAQTEQLGIMQGHY